jgi:hypothetical protein
MLLLREAQPLNVLVHPLQKSGTDLELWHSKMPLARAKVFNFMTLHFLQIGT